MIASSFSMMQQWTPPSPTEFAFADFKNGAYRYNGAGCTRADILEENLDYGTFDPANIVAGTGFTGGASISGTSLVVTAALFAELIASGYTMVIQVKRNVLYNDNISADTADLPSYAQDLWLNIAGSHQSILDYTAGTFTDFGGVTLGGTVHRVALTLTPSLFAASIDGNTVGTLAFDPAALAAANAVGITASRHIIENVTYYSPVAESGLPALSAL